ncbi:MAG: hypothetical protein P8144_04895 [Gammaproteobacteria bacterium]
MSIEIIRHFAKWLRAWLKRDNAEQVASTNMIWVFDSWIKIHDMSNGQTEAFVRWIDIVMCFDDAGERVAKLYTIKHGGGEGKLEGSFKLLNNSLIVGHKFRFFFLAGKNASVNIKCGFYNMMANNCVLIDHCTPEG